MPTNFAGIEYTEPELSARNYLDFHHILKQNRCDLVHIPHMLGAPLYTPCPYVVTVHDLLAYLAWANNGSHWRQMMTGYFSRRAMRKAACILAVSNFTKTEIARYFNVSGDRIEVVYNAIDERFRLGHATDADRQFIAERYQVTYPFLLYAGNIRPHKNIPRMIEAFSALKTELAKEGRFPDLKLIIIGDELSKHPDLRRTVVRGGVQNDVRFMGFVPIEVLRIFYDLAKVFVFPSLYEGFGLPPLEAMAHGTPVLTSNTSSIPEVVGNAAVIVNPENVFEIMRALERVLLDQPLREKMRLRGYEQVKKFSWKDSAAALLAAYEQIVGVPSTAVVQQRVANS
jgi:glycosyltransferase involved in cell wall biosynthesis